LRTSTWAIDLIVPRRGSLRAVREWLETLDETIELPVLAYAAGLDIDLGDEARGATRRALLLLAAGGDPRRDLDLNGRAVTAVADDLDAPGRRAELAEGLAALAAAAGGLPVAARIAHLAAEPELAWRAFAAGLLADSLDDE
jgi:hypothetical protein